MAKATKVICGVTLAYVIVALTLGGLIAYFQPQREGTLVLRTFDDAGVQYETVLRNIEDEHGGKWLWSAKWFRGWYYRALQHPQVEIIENGMSEKRIAVEVTNPEVVQRIVASQREGVSPVQWWFGRSTLLFAPIKILRLDELPNTPNAM